MQLRPVNFVFPPFQGKRPKQSVFLLVLTALAAGVAAGIALERFARGVRVLGVPQPGATSELVAAGMPPPSDLVGTAKQKMFIHVVFFAFVHGAPNVRRSLDLIHLQLGELRDWGLAAAATSVDVVLNGKMEYVFDASVERDLDAAAALIRSLVPRVRITKVPVNRFEYSGIRHVWDLAQEIPDKDAQSHVILYFHTKGLVFGDQTRPRNSWNKLLMEEVVRPWPKLVKRFASDRRLNKAGLLAHGRGWLWNTFFWARAAHIKRCPKPVVTNYRMYYEFWIGMTTSPEHTEADVVLSALDAEMPFNFTSAADTLSMCRQVNPDWKLRVGATSTTVDCLNPAVRNESWVYVHGPLHG